VSLALVEPPLEVSGLPEWIDRSLNVKAGRDPLGLQTITQDRITPVLLPAILVQSSRARYFSFHPFLMLEFEERRFPASNDVLSEFIKQREFEYAVAVQLCPNGCGAISAGNVGKDNAVPALNHAVNDLVPRQESVESYLGGYGLNYRTPLTELGVVIQKGTVYGPKDDEKVTPVDVLARNERARGLAEAFRAAIMDTEYYRDWFVGEAPIPIRVLRHYAERACLCRLREYEAEQELIRRVLFTAPPGEQPAFVARDVDQRRRSFGLLLREIEHDPAVASSDGAYRAAVWADFRASEDQEGPLAQTRAQWAALVAKEYWQEGLSLLYAQLCRLGLERSGPDGLEQTELEELLRGPLAGAGELELGGRKLSYAPEMAAAEFRTLVVDATADLPLEQLRVGAIEDGTAIAGLALILVTVARLPASETAPAGWREIGIQSSERQPSLLQFAMALERQLDEQPPLKDILAWATRRFVIIAHEQIAYSKLPDFTFRFRWEAGRLRFYNLGIGRFELANMRRGTMASLAADVGFWRRDVETPVLTTLGRSFQAEVLR
jgi:hypothetical protein